MDYNLLLIEILLLALVGLTLFWAYLRIRAQGGPWRPELPRAGTAVGWGVLILGLFALVGLTAVIFSPLGWIILAVILLSLLYRYRATERRSLLWTLMVAAERGIPLETAARAFAEERRGFLGARALDLAEYLEAGLPLAIALQRSRLAFPPAVMLAIELGHQTGQLGPCLRQTLQQTDDIDTILQSASERLFYLLLLFFFGVGIWTFLMLKIVPAFEKISYDFGTKLPWVTKAMIAVAWLVAGYWYVALPALVLLAIFVFRVLAYYTGYSSRYLPGMIPLGGRVDRGVVIRWLAVALEQKRSFAEMLRLLSGYVTRGGLRRNLERAARRIDQGSNWTESLQRYGLIDRFELAVFQSAERSGNLAWALAEMAQSSARRSAYRMQAAINVAFPLALLVLASVAIFTALAGLVPLFHLIQVLV